MGAYNKDILFIHIPKTAGWSCKTYMKDHLDGVVMPDDKDSKLPIGHIRLQDIEGFTGRPPDSFEKILAVVRNPYEQQLSQWCFWRERFAKGCSHIHDRCAATYARLEKWLEDPGCDFHIWYEQHTDRREESPYVKGTERYEDFGGFFKFWLTVDGVIPGNVQVARQENLDAEFAQALKPYCNSALQTAACTMPPMPHLNTSPHDADVKKYYTPRAAELVEAKFQWAFENYYTPWKFSEM